MIQRKLQRHADQLVAGAVGAGREFVILFLQGLVNADGHGNGLVLFRGDDKFFHRIPFPQFWLHYSVNYKSESITQYELIFYL